jgi:hypothetical protein
MAAYLDRDQVLECYAVSPALLSRHHKSKDGINVPSVARMGILTLRPSKGTFIKMVSGGGMGRKKELIILQNGERQIKFLV